MEWVNKYQGLKRFLKQNGSVNGFHEPFDKYEESITKSLLLNFPAKYRAKEFILKDVVTSINPPYLAARYGVEGFDQGLLLATETLGCLLMAAYHGSEDELVIHYLKQKTNLSGLELIEKIKKNIYRFVLEKPNIGQDDLLKIARKTGYDKVLYNNGIDFEEKLKDEESFKQSIKCFLDMKLIIGPTVGRTKIIKTKCYEQGLNELSIDKDLRIEFSQLINLLVFLP